jgi:hypothetical protein
LTSWESAIKKARLCGFELSFKFFFQNALDRVNTTFVNSAVFLLFLFPSLCHATIGDTLDQCTARWGRPIDKDRASLIASINAPPVDAVTYKYFSKDGRSYVVGFLNGADCFECIQKDGAAKFTDTEIADVLKEESSGLEWKRDSDASPLWQRSDAVNFSNDPNTRITISSQPLIRLMLEKAGLHVDN